jgi:hypothetical protein
MYRCARRVKLPQGVGPVLRDKQAVSFPHLGPEQGVIHPLSGA